MSSPARTLTPPRPRGPDAPGGDRRAGARRRPRPAGGAGRATRSSPRRAPAPARRGRHQLGFALLASALVGALVFGIVVLHALLAQQSFRISEAEWRIEALGQEHLELVREQATRSAPGRIATWASRHDMRLPDDIRILRAPEGPDDPAGAATSSDDTAPRSANGRAAGGRASGPAEDG